MTATCPADHPAATRAAVTRGRACAAIAGALLLVVVLAGCSPAAPRTTGPSPTAPTTSARALILGDSYTQGRGAVPLTEGWAYHVGPRLGWDVTVNGVGGSGYLNPGSQNLGNYRTRLATLPTQAFDVVVLQGSSNDARYPLDELTPAVQATVDAVHARFPAARVMMMGPVALHGQPIPATAAVHEQLRTYAGTHDIAFIDPIEEAWFVRGESKVVANPENGHPNNAGYARIAELFVRDVQRAG